MIDSLDLRLVWRDSNVKREIRIAHDNLNIYESSSDEVESITLDRDQMRQLLTLLQIWEETVI